MDLFDAGESSLEPSPLFEYNHSLGDGGNGKWRFTLSTISDQCNMHSSFFHFPVKRIKQRVHTALHWVSAAVAQLCYGNVHRVHGDWCSWQPADNSGLDKE